MLKIRQSVGIAFCLVLLAQASTTLARDGEPRLDQASSPIVGVGLEVSQGDYGVNADATLVTLPLSFFWLPAEQVDVAFEVPLLYLSRRSDSGVVATGNSAAGRGRGANRGSPAATGIATETEAGLGDMNMTVGWTALTDGEGPLKVRPTLYLKAPSGDLDRGLGTGTVEAGPGLSLSKGLGGIQLFAEGAYILQNSTSDYPGRHYVSYLAGIGLQTTDRLFVSALAKGSSARADEADAPAEARIKVNLLHSRRISWEIYGLVGLSNASPDYGGGASLIYRF